MSVTVTIGKNVYEEVIIGTQTWMKRNYDFGGTAYDNNMSNVAAYGKLYTWAEAMAIDEPGWHLPADSEWATLRTYVGGSTAAGHIKEAGTTHWTTPNEGADNTSGFTGVGAGYYDLDMDTFYSLNQTLMCWTATEDGVDNAWTRGAVYTTANFSATSVPKVDKCSVRLIKD